MRAWFAFACVMEQCLADHATEGTELERVGVIAKGALGRHHTRVRTLFSGMVGATFLVLFAVILAGYWAYTAAVILVRFDRAAVLVRFHGAYTTTTSGSFCERAERAHGN